jgi:hypothetical protein
MEVFALLLHPGSYPGAKTLRKKEKQNPRKLNS